MLELRVEWLGGPAWQALHVDERLVLGDVQVRLPREVDLRTLVSVPLFHVTGCNSQLLVACELGGTTVIMPAFEVKAFLEAIAAERIDMLTTVPAIYWLAISQPEFADTDVSSVQWASYGGAPIAPDLVRRIMAAFPNARVGNGFGLTECSSIATFLPHEYAESRPETVGSLTLPRSTEEVDAPTT